MGSLALLLKAFLMASTACWCVTPCSDSPSIDTSSNPACTQSREKVCFKHLLTCSTSVLISYSECTFIPACFCQHTDTFTWIKHWHGRNVRKDKPPVISLVLFLQYVSELNQPSESLLFISSLVCLPASTVTKRRQNTDVASCVVQCNSYEFLRLQIGLLVF